MRAASIQDGTRDCSAKTPSRRRNMVRPTTSVPAEMRSAGSIPCQSARWYVWSGSPAAPALTAGSVSA